MCSFNAVNVTFTVHIAQCMSQQFEYVVLVDTEALASQEVWEKVDGRTAIRPDLHKPEQQHSSLRKRPGQQIPMQISGVTV